MYSKYLIRLDDASHYSNEEKWDRIESILIKFKIKPIVAVIPNNKDKNIMYSKANKFFWKKVKYWESLGWTIAMHGYEHKFHKVNKSSLIFPFYNQSEFAELTVDEQSYKINKSLEIFKKNDIYPKLWIAPAHTFDKNTLVALKKSTKIKTISDGISLNPFLSNGFNFIPQQLWSFKYKSFGLWTICLHPDTMTENEFKKIEQSISKYISKNIFIGLEELDLNFLNKSFLDLIYSYSFWIRYNINQLIKLTKFFNIIVPRNIAGTHIKIKDLNS